MTSMSNWTRAPGAAVHLEDEIGTRCGKILPREWQTDDVVKVTCKICLKLLGLYVTAVPANITWRERVENYQAIIARGAP